MIYDLGPVYTRGPTFRARAEARQREYRANDLRVGWSKYGHLLDAAAAAAGANFVTPEAHKKARERSEQGKGVGERTFTNMLSSQAMCFNIFAPLANRPDLAVAVLQPFFPVLASVRSIAIEYTPETEVFGDQTGRGGVDCDLLVDATDQDGAGVVLSIETKFVEPEFSTCGFRKTDRKAKDQPICPEDVPVRAEPGACLYKERKGYLYWQRTGEHRTLSLAAMPEVGCPFGGVEWQLWVNHTLVHEVGARRGASRAIFAVCAPATNKRLLGGGVVERFRERLSQPESFALVSLEDVLARIASVTEGVPDLRAWSAGLSARYGGI